MVDDHRPRVPEEDPFATPSQHRANRASRRQVKINAEMDRNRRGDHRIPTWVMLLAVVVLLLAYAAILFLA